MTKDEALGLALEALTRWAPPFYAGKDARMAEKAITAIKQTRALDKKAENARELGLDYEPSAKVRDFWEGYVPEPQYSVNCVNHDCDKCKAAAQPAPVQEPVGYVAENGVVDWNVCAPPILTDLYTTPPAQPAPVQEPGTLNINRLGQWLDASLKERAAQRQWVGLTEQERNDIEDYCEMIIGKPTFDAIEAKLREKNT